MNGLYHGVESDGWGVLYVSEGEKSGKLLIDNFLKKTC